MPEISADEVRKVATLANLKIADDEVASLAASLSGILEHIHKLEGLDTSGVAPTSHVLQVENVFREDEVTSHFERGKSLDNAPEKSKGYFSVPRVIE